MSAYGSDSGEDGSFWADMCPNIQPVGSASQSDPSTCVRDSVDFLFGDPSVSLHPRQREEAAHPGARVQSEKSKRVRSGLAIVAANPEAASRGAGKRSLLTMARRPYSISDSENDESTTSIQLY